MLLLVIILICLSLCLLVEFVDAIIFLFELRVGDELVFWEDISEIKEEIIE